MYPIEEFEFYDGHSLTENEAVLTWCKQNGYQFMQAKSLQDHHRVVGYRP